MIYISSVNIKYLNYQRLSPITYGLAQGSILGLLLFLLYINNMPLAVDSELLLYVHDNCLVFQRKDLKAIDEHQYPSTLIH